MKRKMRCLFVCALTAGLFAVNPVKGQTNLTWDPGTARSGTEIFTNTSTSAGSYLFSITTTNTANNVGFWRTVLTVNTGADADLYMSQSSNVTSSTSTHKSEDPGDDTITQPLTAG